MGDPKYTCPLCCNKTFSNKQLLQAHLSDILQNLYCPICKNKWASLVHLIEHLNLDNCQPEDTEHTILFDTGTQGGRNESTSEISNVTEIEHLDGSGSDQFSSNTLDSPANNEMYVEFLSKQFSKPCLQTQSLKLVRDPDEQRESYFVVTQDNAELNAGHTIVTKQNKDGTISLTAVKDMKIETDTLISQSENDVEDSQAEIYSCNTCGVSFSSVLDHIQNYHNDQEVVVEEPIEEGENDASPIEYDNIDQDPLTPSDKQTPRRVITDTGDIVEAPLVVKSISELQSQQIVPTNLKSEEVTDNEGRVYTRRYVQIEKFCDSVIKDIKENDDKDGGPYHKVVFKEVQTTNGTNVKMYHCMSCNIYVSTLNEFKAHPCKTLKYKCPHCPVAYENSKSLCAHMKVHKLKAEGNTKVPVRYKCEVCCTVFPSNKSLKLHKRMHDPIKARPIEPPLVNRFGKEPSEGRYCCPTCDKMIPIDYKTIHQNSHKSSEKMNCQICNKKFSSEEYLEMHMTVHNVDKVTVNKQDKSLPYNCLYCNRRFARPHEKVKHERIHTGEKPHSCEICGKSFRVSYCLTLHMRTHTGARPYACPHCGKRFKAHSVFNHHLLTHSEVRAYKCPYCPKAFKTSVQLAGHKNSHTKPFSCQHCNRPFASLYAVRVHTETHARQNNLKFSCSLCGASYARAFALKDHVKQIHKQDIESNDNLGGVKEEDWMIRENTDNARSLKTAPSLPTEINVLGMASNELIVP